MQIRPMRLNGTFAITPAPLRDARGYFMRTYDADILREHGLTTAWVQENQSFSNRKGLIRGLHFLLPPYTETKLVRAIAGAFRSVFVDMRTDSETFGQWDSIELSAESGRMVYIPKGFAHGLCTLTEQAVALYKVDSFYCKEADSGLRWNDPTLNIEWPAENPFLSERDQALPLFKDFHSPFALSPIKGK